MALVDYASSDDEIEYSNDEHEQAKPQISKTSDTTALQPLKRKRESDLPPLPSKFHDLYASTTRFSTKDDPSLHGGRKRVTPHVEGNWPTHVYIEWNPSTTEHNLLTTLLHPLLDDTQTQVPETKVHSFLISDLGAPLPLHISLSRPIAFPTDRKDDFVNSLTRTIDSSSVRPFNVSVSSLDWVSNFEGTRWFLVLRLHKPENDELTKLLHISNKIVQEHDQPPLYAKPASTSQMCSKMKPQTSASFRDDMQDLTSAFHISIAWNLNAPSQELLEKTQDLNLNSMNGISVEVKEIKAKVGNVVTNIPLSRGVTVSKSLFGA